MVKLFKNHVLSIFIVIAFFLSHVVNVNANHLRNSTQKEEISVSVIEQEIKKAMNMAALYIPGLNHGAENDAAIEGKIEKVLEPITIGVFGFGIAAGYAATAIGMFMGWIIKRIVSALR
ncbi:hypothetical protein [Bartonella jaculi]|uniref:Uncharacterized protein n=1 Tax=Bartonella jaculi TaxID=686226 RepID=A0ABP9MWS0_9HYPH